MLAASRRPVFLMGRVSRDRGDWDRRVALAEHFEAKVVTDIKTAAAFPTRHPLHSGAPSYFVSQDAVRDIAAADLVNRAEPDELIHILRAYGEEPRAPKIVRVILDRRPIETTAQLADAVRAAVPYKEEVKSLSRVFQALRIAVNDELAVLERALVAALRVLKTGGRLAVIAYHSLEDRRAKQFLRYGNFDGEPVRDFYGNLLTPWEPLTRKPITASDAEIDANPRARSARLRIAEKRDPEESGLGTAYSYPQAP